MPYGDDDLADFDVDGSSWTQLSTCLPFADFSARHSTHLSLRFGINTRQPEALRPRVAGAQNCEQITPGIAVAGLPPSTNREQRKTRIASRLQERATAVREFRGCDVRVADSFLLVDRFFGCREGKCAPDSVNDTTAKMSVVSHLALAPIKSACASEKEEFSSWTEWPT